MLCRLGPITLSTGIRFPIFSQISLTLAHLHLFYPHFSVFVLCTPTLAVFMPLASLLTPQFLLFLSFGLLVAPHWCYCPWLRGRGFGTQLRPSLAKTCLLPPSVREAGGRRMTWERRKIKPLWHPPHVAILHMQSNYQNECIAVVVSYNLLWDEKLTLRNNPFLSCDKLKLIRVLSRNHVPHHILNKLQLKFFSKLNVNLYCNMICSFCPPIRLRGNCRGSNWNHELSSWR